MRTEDDLRAALMSLERHTPAADRVLPETARRSVRGGCSRHGLRSPKTIGWLSGITTVAALAGVVTAVALPATPNRDVPNGPVTSPGRAAAPVTPVSLRARLLAAFSATSGEIVYERGSTAVAAGAPPMTEESWYYPWQPNTGQQVRSRQLILTGGKPYQDVEYIYKVPALGTIPPGLPPATRQKIKMAQRVVGAVAATGEIIDVEYGNRTWSDQKNHALINSDPASPQVVLYEIKHENWTIVGHTTLDGHDAIELSWPDGDATSYLWVDASTYLPLREIQTIPAAGPGKTITTISQTDYELLPPTAANLALLTLPIPAGFRRTATQVLPESGGGLG